MCYAVDNTSERGPTKEIRMASKMKQGARSAVLRAAVESPASIHLSKANWRTQKPYSFDGMKPLEVTG